MNNNKSYAIGAAVLVVIIVVVAVIVLTSKPPEVVPEAPPLVEVAVERPVTEVMPPPTPPPAPVEEEVFEVAVQEARFLPERASLPEQRASATLLPPEFTEGNRRMTEVEKVTSLDKHGELMHPRLSPDGLQMLVTRPGFQGLFMVDTKGGDLIQISEDSGWGAKWTEDGKVEIVDRDNVKRTYGPDGTLESAEQFDPKSQSAYHENDAIFIRPGGPDSPPVPLTAGEDRYYAPIVSPDGTHIVYSGLYSGLYLAPIDGSSEPVYLGQGHHVSWLPDSTGVVYDISTDDGHHLTSSDVFLLDLTANQRSNLTQGNQGIAQQPWIGPDGRVTWETEGEVYMGRMQ